MQRAVEGLDTGGGMSEERDSNKPRCWGEDPEEKDSLKGDAASNG